jgi:hypothetical protein
MAERSENTVIIAEIEHSTGFDYVSDIGYMSKPTDSPANQNYLSILDGNIETEESISLELESSLTISEIQIKNVDGRFDNILTKNYKNRSIKIYYGDKYSAKSTFTLIYDGLINEVLIKEENTLSIVCVDKMLRLNSPFSEALVKDLNISGGTNKDKLIPNVLGEVFNVSGVLIEDNLNSNYVWKVSNFPIEGFIECRDAGNPVTTTNNLTSATYTYSVKPSAEMTASVQGYKSGTYYNDCANLIKIAVLNFGKASDRFQSSDIDLTNFSNFSASWPQAMGTYISEKVNVIDVIKSFALSLEACVLCNRLGKLQIFSVTSAPSGTVRNLENRILARTLKPVKTTSPKGVIKLNYCQNYTVQSNIKSGIREKAKEFFKNEWLVSTQTDPTTISNYKLSSEATPIDTKLINGAEADTESSRRLAFWKVIHNIYEFEGTPDLINLTLNEAVFLKHRRYNLSSGVTGKVVKIKINWKFFKPTVQVLV